MKRAFVATVLALSMLVVAGGAVWAADVSGTVKTIVVKERVLTLDDGTKLYWNETYNVAPEIKEGAKIKATYEPKDGKYVLTQIEVQQ